jgi:branched-chain amino acid transport system permease protein/urea transport system permease protein
VELLATYALNFVYAFANLAIIVLGLAIVFGLLGVMNMAHGEFIALGAYSLLVVQQAGLPLLLAIPLAILIGGALAVVIEHLVIRHLYHRPFDTLLATWAIAILMRKSIEIGFGREFQSVEPVLPGSVNLFGVLYPSYRLLLIAIVITIFAGLYLWYQRSNAGLRVRAMVENPDLAVALGINTHRLSRLTFVAGAVIASLAGVLIAPLVRVEPFMGVDYLLNSFFILVVGGMGSIQGLLTGAAVVGGSDTLLSALFDKSAGYVGVLLISILFLWMRPNGIYARR